MNLGIHEPHEVGKLKPQNGPRASNFRRYSKTKTERWVDDDDDFRRW